MKPALTSIVATLPALWLGLAIAGDEATSQNNTAVVVRAINRLGFEILRAGIPAADNGALSPYSIQLATSMLYAGAEGKTRKEMATTLHYPDDERFVHETFANLNHAVQGTAHGAAINLSLVNRLYAQTGCSFRPAFLTLLDTGYHAPLVQVDFLKGPGQVARDINAWIDEQTQHRIHELVGPSVLDATTRLAIVNAIYLKAAWRHVFSSDATRPQRFIVRDQEAVAVPTMTTQAEFGYWKRARFSVIALPYKNDDLQFLIFLPERTFSLLDLESLLTTADLSNLRHSPTAHLILHLPKLKIGPPPLSLAKTLSALGMKSAFEPREADFRRMESSRDLYLSTIIHKTSLAIDEEGTEATVASYADFALPAAPPPPIEVRVDRPFLFAIQHMPTGALLFLGRVTDPR